MLIRPISESNVAPQKTLNNVNDMYDLDIELSRIPASVGSLVNQLMVPTATCHEHVLKS